MKNTHIVIEQEYKTIDKFKMEKLAINMDIHKGIILNNIKRIRTLLIETNKILERWGAAAGSAIRN